MPLADTSYERRLARTIRELNSLRVEKLHGDAAAIREDQFLAVASRATHSLREDHSLNDLRLWVSWFRHEASGNFHTAEEQKYGVADKKVGPTDAMREEIRRMGPVQKLEYAELNLAPKKADRQ